MKTVKRVFIAILVLIALLVPSIETGLAKSKKKKETPKGTPVMWRKPDDIRSRNLFLGPGGEDMRPDLEHITFLKEEKGGYSKKYRVRDGSGREWVVKIGKEAQSETAAVRLLWGVGYLTEVNYLVPRVTIPGKGSFSNARFEARPDGWKRGPEWKWKQNPFTSRPEYQGLKIMMALINNWDLKDSTNVMLQVPTDRGNEVRYVISDLGATFGHASTTPVFWRITRSRNNPKNYAKSDFLEKVKGNRIALHFGGKNRGLMKDLTVNDAIWIGGLLAELSDQQIKDAFRAANYRPDQVDVLARVVRARTNELLNLRPNIQIGSSE